MTTREYLAIEPNRLLENEAEMLRRQVHPDHNKAGVLSKQAFLPTAEHAFLLSTKREHVAPKEAYETHRAKPLETCGTWSINVGVAKQNGLPSVDDAIHVDEVAHASVSFRDVATPGQRQQKARKLRDAAACLYDPSADEDEASVGVDAAEPVVPGREPAEMAAPRGAD